MKVQSNRQLLAPTRQYTSGKRFALRCSPPVDIDGAFHRFIAGHFHAIEDPLGTNAVFSKTGNVPGFKMALVHSV